MGDDGSRIGGVMLNVGFAVAAALVLVLAYALATRFLLPEATPTRSANPAGLLGDIVQVEVLNGCGAPGVAADVTRFLRDHHFDVVASGNYVDFAQPHSLVIDRVGNREAALRVAAILGIDEAYVREEIGPNYFVDASVVIGRDYPRLRPFEDDAQAFAGTRLFSSAR
jgi:hypothetical protein